MSERRDSKSRFMRHNGRDEVPCFKDGVHCTERRPGCQDKCERFLAAKAKNEARKAIERQKRTFDSELRGHLYARALHSQGKKMPER